VIVPDVNVLVYAHREDMSEHEPYREWLDWLVNSGRAYGMSEMVLSSFVRIVTNRRTFREATGTREALASAARLLAPPQCVPVRPGPRHWEIFDGLCRRHTVAAKLVADAYLAAIVMEAGCDLATADGDFARFEGLRWHHPLAGRPGVPADVLMEPRRRPWLTSD
jgi:hypothetical protein